MGCARFAPLNMILTPCSFSISARMASIARSSPKPLMMTLHPAAANRLAVARPSPCVDPVMSAHLPWSIVQYALRQLSIIMIDPAAMEPFEIFAIRYGHLGNRHTGQSYILADPHEYGPDLDYFVWVVRRSDC